MTKAQTVRQWPECVHCTSMPSASSPYSSHSPTTSATVPKPARSICQRGNWFNMGFVERCKLQKWLYLSNYKNAETILKRSRSFFNSMSAAVVFIPDQSEVTHIETADYRMNFEHKTRKIHVSSVGTIPFRCGRRSWFGAWTEFDHNSRHVWLCHSQLRQPSSSRALCHVQSQLKLLHCTA